MTAATVERTLQLCSLERRLQKTGACPRADLAPRRTACVSRRLRTLNALRRPLEAALETDRTRWRREVTPCLGWVYDELITTLVDAPLPATVPQTRAARYRAGLGDLAFGLRAARQALDPKVAAAITTRVEASLLPEPGQAVSPVLALIAGRRYAAAEHVATRALAAHGERADLYCARALSRLLLQQVHASVGDLRRALAVDPGSRCARRNLARILTEPGLPADGPGAPVSSRQDSLHNPDGSQSPDAC